MGFFSSSTSTNHKPDAVQAGGGTGNGPAWERRKHREAAGLSIVAKDLTVTGDLEAEGVIRIEGRVLGNVQAGDQVLLSDGGIVEGNVVTREAVIGGTVHGSIATSERVELQSDAVVEGDISTRRLLIHEGGRVNGAVRMEAVSSEP